MMPSGNQPNYRLRRWLASLALAIVILGLISMFVPILGEICSKDEYTGQKECPSYHIAPYVLWHIGKFLEDHAGAITGIATALLAYITWRLVLLGHEQSVTARQQLRAYISVQIGMAVEQNSQKGVRFEAKPLLINAGNTPAYKVRFESTAEIIPNTLVAGYSFTPPNTGIKSEASVGPHESRYLSAVVPGFVPDHEIPGVKLGNEKCLWAWGVVYYEDVFGDEHFTEFCQRIFWTDTAGQIFGLYDPRFGRSN